MNLLSMFQNSVVVSRILYDNQNMGSGWCTALTMIGWQLVDAISRVSFPFTYRVIAVKPYTLGE